MIEDREMPGNNVLGGVRVLVVEDENDARDLIAILLESVGAKVAPVDNVSDALEIFKSDRYQEFSFSEWLAHTPPELVMAHLKIDRATYDAIPKTGVAVTPL